MNVVAKFTCREVRRIMSSVPQCDDKGKTVYIPGELRTVILSPVYGNGDPTHENTKFWQASPSGSIEIGCANLAAADAFEIGKEYYVTFSDAPLVQVPGL